MFYLQSTSDSTYATNSFFDSYYFADLGAPCSASSTLYALNTTSSELLMPSTGYVASNIACCGGAGLPVAFSDPSTLGEGFTALNCEVDGGVLSCGLFGSTDPWTDCDGLMVLGSSHLCDATSILVVEPVFT